VKVPEHHRAIASLNFSFNPFKERTMRTFKVQVWQPEEEFSEIPIKGELYLENAKNFDANQEFQLEIVQEESVAKHTALSPTAFRQQIILSVLPSICQSEPVEIAEHAIAIADAIVTREIAQPQTQNHEPKIFH